MDELTPTLGGLALHQPTASWRHRYRLRQRRRESRGGGAGPGLFEDGEIQVHRRILDQSSSDPMLAYLIYWPLLEAA